MSLLPNICLSGVLVGICAAVAGLWFGKFALGSAVTICWLVVAAAEADADADDDTGVPEPGIRLAVAGRVHLEP